MYTEYCTPFHVDAYTYEVTFERKATKTFLAFIAWKLPLCAIIKKYTGNCIEFCSCSFCFIYDLGLARSALSDGDRKKKIRKYVQFTKLQTRVSLYSNSIIREMISTFVALTKLPFMNYESNPIHNLLPLQSVSIHEQFRCSSKIQWIAAYSTT